MGGLSQERKLDLVFKALLGREETTTDKTWYEEYPGHATLLHSSEIFVDEIPETPPVSDTDIIKIFNQFEMTEDITVSDHRAWKIYETPGDRTSNRLKYFIHPRFGQGYTARIYDNNGNEIPTTHESRWVFLYELGILVFENDPTTFGITLPIKISCYQYIGKTLNDKLKNSGIKWSMIMT